MGTVLGLCLPHAAAVPCFLSVCSSGTEVALSDGSSAAAQAGGEMETDLQHSQGGSGWCRGEVRSWLCRGSPWPRCLPWQRAW